MSYCVGLVLGPKGSTLKQLQDQFGVRIFLRGHGSQKDGQSTHPDDDDDLHASIEGPEDNVKRALRELETILHDPEQASKLKSEQLKSLGMGNYSSSEFTDEIKVPNPFVGLIIGRGGENVQKLQFQTGAHIQIAKESEMKPGETMRTIYLRGTPDAVADLKRKIDEIVNQKNGGKSNESAHKYSRDLEHPFVIKIPIPNDRVGYVIGKGGANVKNIQDKTSTAIYIPQDPDADDPNVRTINIGAHTKEDAEAAHHEIFLALQQYNQHVLGIGGSAPLLVTIADEKVGIFIGKNGANIRDMQNKFGVKIQVPPTADLGSNPPVRTCT